MGLRLRDRWIWDFWHVQDGDRHHLFYLQAPRSLPSPDDRHWNVSVGHAVSGDLCSWEVLPDALAPAAPGAWDDCTTWTGSVIAHDGGWWMFYTGTSREEDGLVQRVGLATSDDLVHWRRQGTEPLLELDPQWYEELDLSLWHDQAWRDPWVFRGADGGFHAFLTARVNHGDPATRGVVGHAVSDDLLHWSVRPPVTEPGRFGHLEIPQLVCSNGRSWLLFSTPPAPPEVASRFPDTAVEGTHVLVADDPLGPYDWSGHHLLDGDAGASRYGGKLVERPDGWALLVWLNHDASGRFVGEVSDPVPVGVRDGRLVHRPLG